MSAANQNDPALSGNIQQNHLHEERPAEAPVLQFLQVGQTQVGVELLTRHLSPCSKDECGGRCCRFGALVDDDQRLRIHELLPRLLPILRPAARASIRQLGWHFSTAVHERYASGHERYTATRVVAGTCVFSLDIQEGGCALHHLALQEGVPISAYKPRECVLFPLNALHAGRLHLHRWDGFPCLTERPAAPCAWRTLEGELREALGPQDHDALKARIETLSPDVQLQPPEFSDPMPVPRGRRPAASSVLPTLSPAPHNG